MIKRILVSVLISMLALAALQPSRRTVSSVSFIQKGNKSFGFSVLQNANFNDISIFSNNSRNELGDFTVNLALRSEDTTDHRVSLKNILIKGNNNEPLRRVDISNSGEKIFSGGLAVFTNQAIPFQNSPLLPATIVFSLCNRQCEDISIDGIFSLEQRSEFGFRVLWNLQSV